MIRVYDFLCENGHRVERFVTTEFHTAKCTLCDAFAARQFPAPRSELEGITGDFPTAADKWANDRDSKLRAERKTMENHGEYHSKKIRKVSE